MNFYFRIFFVFFSLMTLVCGSAAFGKCIGSVPVWGTDDDKASCLRQKLLKKERIRLNMEKEELAIDKERQQLNNSGTGSGTGNTNVILGGLHDMMKPDAANAGEIKDIVFTRHQVRVELMPYVIPGAYQFDEPGMPEGIAVGAAWEYFLNKNLAVGFLWQQWIRNGGKRFDPVMAVQRDGSGDTAVFFPGAVDRIQYTSYNLYASINSEITTSWMSIMRFGLGITEAKVEYSDIDAAKHPYANQPRDKTYTDSAALMAGLAVEYIAQGGTRLGGEIRYHNARHDTNDYTEYMNLGSTQVVFYAQFMLNALGLL